ncbi:MAG TPA: response regulator transcription factor [Bacteroidota bacterium]
MNALRILVVDDHAAFRQSLSEFLRSQAGIEVVGEATNGEEAVEKTLELRPDLVLMDVSMPTMSGYDATRIIKEQHPETRVVILSSHTGEVYRSAARESHADGYIEKNSMKNELTLLIAQNVHAGVRMAV